MMHTIDTDAIVLLNPLVEFSFWGGPEMYYCYYVNIIFEKVGEDNSIFMLPFHASKVVTWPHLFLEEVKGWLGMFVPK